MGGSLIYRFLWLVLNLGRRLGLLRWRVEGLEHLPASGGLVVISNHVHWLDILVQGTVMPWKRRAKWVGKAELFEKPLSRAFMTVMQVIPIRRGQRDMSALDSAVDVIRGGALVIIYPEGHRSHTGILQKGKPGALVLAAESGRPLLPMAITGTEHGFGGLFRRQEIVVRIGESFAPPTLDGEEVTLRTMSRFTTDMMLTIALLLPERFRGHYSAKSLAAPPELLPEHDRH